MASKKNTPVLDLLEFNPETPVTSTDVSDYQKKVKMLVASCSRELDRITSENGVRIGDSVLHEAAAVTKFKAVLSNLIVYYQSMTNE